VDVSDEAVEKMLADSLEHAFEDMNERAFAEARLKAEEMLPAVRTGLQRAGTALTEEERVEISRCTDAVQVALASGAAPPLKKALAALDTSTQRLAAILVEQAMEKK